MAENELTTAEAIEKLSAEFDNRTFERHVMGQEKYGKFTWMENNTIEMAIEEVLDLANYARYTYVKLRLLQLHAAKMVNEIDEVSDLGKDSFKKGLDS